MTFAPIVPNIQSTAGAYSNKYGINPLTGASTGQSQYTPGLISSLPGASFQSTISPLQRYDLQRIMRGQMPLTSTQSALALRALASRQPATPAKSQGFFANVLSDARSLISSIPKIPMGLFHEAQSLPDLATQLPQAASGNPLATLGNVASLPGFRFIPGSFVAQQLLADKEHGGTGFRGLQAHPLFTLLDVLPAAEGVAKLSPAYKTAKAAIEPANLARTEAQVARGLPASTTQLIGEPRALQTALTRRLPRSAEEAARVNELGLVPTRIGQATRGVSDLLGSTGIGRTLQGTFLERNVPRLSEWGTEFIRHAANPDVPTPLLRPNVPHWETEIADALGVRDAGAKFQQNLRATIPDNARGMEFYDAVQNPRLPDGTPTTPEQLPGWSEEERALMRELRDFQTTHGEYLATSKDVPAEARLVQRNVDGTPEFYEHRAGLRVARAQQQVTRAREIMSIREMISDPSKVDIGAIDRSIADVMTRQQAGVLKASEANQLIQGFKTAAEEAGYRLEQNGQWVHADPAPRPTTAQIIEALKPYARTQPVVTRAIDALQEGKWSKASKALAQLDKRTTHVLPIDMEGFRYEMSRLANRDRAGRFMAKTEHVTEDYISRLERLQGKVEQQAIPARFVPLAQDIARETTRGRIKEAFFHDPDLDRLIADFDAGIHDSLITRGGDEWARIIRQDQVAARNTWKALREGGADPIYVARVAPEQAARQAFARVGPAPRSIAATKARMFDATPTVKDTGVAVNQQGLDIISRLATKASLDEIGRYGVPRNQLVAELRDLAASRAARYPDVPEATHLQNLIDQRWVRWNPGNYDRSLGVFSPERVTDTYIPRVMHEQIQKMYEPPLPKLTSVMDPVMHMFRTSVLPLALRWHLNNVVSGGIIMGINDPRAFMELPRVWREMRREVKGMKGEIPGYTEAERITLPGSPPSTVGGQPVELMAWEKKVHAGSPLADRVAAVHNWGVGDMFKRWSDEARLGRASKIKDAARRAVTASYDANQFIDDVVRASIGESYRKSLIRKGMDEGLVDAMVSGRIRKVFQAWDEMTPMERSVIRAVIPFYGFASFATRYALKYPFDHPFRASVLNSITRAELTDAMTGLPEYLRDMIFLGDPRANKATKALNIQPFNPFGGVPSMFTLQGLVGQLAPQYTAVLESLGINPQQGGPSLYPETHYDPETGRLVAGGTGNLASNLMNQAIPQLGGVMALLGQNEEFKDTLARDPSAAGRMLLGNFGIPVLFRNVDTGQEQIKSEMARYEDEQNARRNALQTGDLGSLSAYPGLAGYADQVRALDKSGQLDQLRITGLPPALRSVLPTKDASRIYAAQVALLGQTGTG